MAQTLVVVSTSLRRDARVLADVARLFAEGSPPGGLFVSGPKAKPGPARRPRMIHRRSLRRLGVQVHDARPTSFFRTGRLALDPEVREDAALWARRVFRQAETVFVADHRAVFFIPLWAHVADEVGARLVPVEVMRHPAELTRPKKTRAVPWHPSHRAAAWINRNLYGERSSRHGERVFVSAADARVNWRSVFTRISPLVGVDLVEGAPVSARREADRFSRKLKVRDVSGWEADGVYEPVAELARSVWGDLQLLAGGPDEPRAVLERLDAHREAYVDLYGHVEAVARSTLTAAEREAVRHARRADTTDAPDRGRVVRLARRLPRRLRHLVPGAVRRSLRRSTGR